MALRWTQDEQVLDLLERSGNPFNSSAYRRGWTEVVAGSRDVSFGAHASDGTRAAIALVKNGRLGRSVPLGYGGIVASRPLDEDDAMSFLDAARRSTDVYELRAISVPIDPAAEQLETGARVTVWTSVLYLDRAAPADARLTKKGRQTLARATRAGGTPQPVSTDPEPFLALYDRASTSWSMRYPAGLLRHLADAGLLALYNAELEGKVQASAVALRGEGHWMYWLAAQSDAGRSAELGYLALASLIRDAHAAGASAVNLGGSTGLPGVAAFKRRFGGVDVPVLELRSRYLPYALLEGILSAGRTSFGSAKRRVRRRSSV